MSPDYDVVVVGSGIGGYPAAVLLAKRGLRVALIEKHRIGGECVNYGCIPSKALLHYAHVMKEAARLGARVQGVSIRDALEYAYRVASEDREGIEGLLDRVGVDIYRGTAEPHRLGEVNQVKIGDDTVTARRIIVATGSEPLWPQWAQRCERVGDNRDFFSKGLPEDAENIAVIGAGFIGVELSQAMSAMGLHVTVYEALPDVLPGFDKDLARIARRALRDHGVTVKTRTPVESVKCVDGKARLCARGECTDYDYVLVAIGRRPSDTSQYRALGVETSEKGFIVTNEKCETSVRNVYAVGDITGPPLLAHKAVHESLCAARAILGQDCRKPRVVPLVVYGHPEMAVIESGCSSCKTRTVKLYWGYNAIARIEGYKAQLVFAKLVVDEQTGRLIAAYLAGPRVSEFAAELALAIEAGVSIDTVRRTVHPHPSASEAVWETVLSMLGEDFNKT